MDEVFYFSDILFKHILCFVKRISVYYKLFVKIINIAWFPKSKHDEE